MAEIPNTNAVPPSVPVNLQLDTNERIAAALERIAAALESGKSGSSPSPVVKVPWVPHPIGRR